MPVYAGGSHNILGGKNARGTGGNQGGGFYVTAINADAVNAIVESVGKQMKTATNSQIRAASKQIAKDILKPALDQAKMTAQPKIAKHMEVRPKIDRLVAVQIGSVNPKGLKGFKRNKPGSRRWRTSLAWGSELGPYLPLTHGNHYGVPRNDPAGYWVQKTVTRKIPQIVDEYNDALYEIWKWAIAQHRSMIKRAA